MTERATERKSAPEAARNGSRVSALANGVKERLRGGGGAAAAVLVLGALAAVLMVAAELSTFRSIEVVTASCEELSRSTGPDVADDCVTSGGEQHGYALIPIALLTLLMAWGAGPGRSRPAAAALVFLGIVVVAVALVLDLPDVDVTGAVGRNFDQAEGQAGATVALEITAGVLALAAGAARLLVERRRAARP